ncbi:gluconokinase [Lacticaseibacillus camelliae]|uniref:Gluconokinase n=1 Tax=Lacticaseibacillus camelliae DSM 22697 = JCM 13995 TaxID=1423730 RepID=A0A0R2FBK0_9LACO|nr:gluconokinase [Lacticaseibacillus camelliae]KRN25839.1 gluconokinase [Lacticaseibacillus camelliae DSM 22697 = JCM 13995]
MAVVIGVDVGTTATKVVAFDAAGQVKAQASRAYPLLQAQPGAAELDPQAILAAVQAGLKAVAGALPAGSVAGISFSAAMHSLMLLDEKRQPLTRVITWADIRAERAAEQLKARPDHAALVGRTGVPLHPMTPLAKLIDLQQTRPELMVQTRFVCGIKSWLLLQLYGQWVADYSLANATGLFNMARMDWDAQALKLAGVSAAQLPNLVDTDTLLPQLTGKSASTLGLPQTTSGIVGASDGTLANIGVNALAPGATAVTIGTSGTVRTVIQTPTVAPSGKLFTYYLAPNRWVVGGPVNNGGIVLQWATRTLLGQAETVEDAIALALTAPAGAHGLVFLPYLGGERAPLWDANARGSFVGLTRSHTKADMLRAVMEGILFNLKAAFALMAPLVGAKPTLHAAGGFAKSLAWRQMLADVFDCPVVVPQSVQSSALGAAVIGMKRLGWVPDLDAVAAMVKLSGSYQPGADAAVYRRLWPLWQQVAQALAGTYADLAGFTAGRGMV